MSRASLQLFGVSASSMLIGLGVGYMYAQKKLGLEFEQRLADETAEMREFYTIHRKKYPNPVEAAKELIPETTLTPEEVKQAKVAYHKIVKSEYSPNDDPEEEHAIDAELGEDSHVIVGSDGTLMVDGLVHTNVFGTKVTPDKPYVITQEEFMQNEPGYEQSTLTYYEKCGSLADERDDIIDTAEDVVGLQNMQRFGEGSSDKNTIHIRNQVLRMDFEVIHSERSFAEDVLGESER
jgi:hypothetical protein